MGTLFWATVLSWRNSHHWNLNYNNSMQNLSQIFIILLVSQSVSHDTSTLYRHTFPTWTSRLWSLGPWRTVPRTSRQQGIWEIKINRLFNFFPTTSLKFQGPFSRGSVATNSFLTPTPAPENRICFFCTFQYLLRQLLIKKSAWDRAFFTNCKAAKKEFYVPLLSSASKLISKNSITKMHFNTPDDQEAYFTHNFA